MPQPPGLERRFDTAFVAALALREKQIQQVYRPVIAVHKWFARRPGSLFRSLILAEFGQRPLSDDYYEGHRLDGIRIVDPFMGGGTTVYEATRLGAEVVGCDINPMSYWVVREAVTDIDLHAYQSAADAIREALAAELADLYETQCVHCGETAKVKSFLWVKELPACSDCDQPVALYPGYLIAENKRHPKNVLLCWYCEELAEVGDRRQPGDCPNCGSHLRLDGPAKRGHCVCSNCGTDNRWPRGDNVPQHRLFAMEYHCQRCRRTHAGRFFKRPDADDIRRVVVASDRLEATPSTFRPSNEIPYGQETARLHKWGYKRYAHLFNDRQLLALETLARLIGEVSDLRIRDALATNFSDLLRYQNMLCRYDTMALKCLDVFSIHGYPAGLVQCEANALGVRQGSTNIGSGGWTNIVDKYVKAKNYCKEPYETQVVGKRKVRVQTPQEYIGLPSELTQDTDPNAWLRCGSSSELVLPDNSVDAVFTDPPYLGNVQYAELIDFCYVWLRRLVGDRHPVLAPESTAHAEEVVRNAVDGRGEEVFAAGLSAVYVNMAAALKPGAPLVFTYHHNDLNAYAPAALALLDAGMVCTRVLASPAEMGASIHISGTGSSIVDSVIVARKPPVEPALFATTDPWVAAKDDVADLVRAGVRVTQGDVRCVLYGHLTRVVVNGLREAWVPARPIADRLAVVTAALKTAAGHEVERGITEIHAGATG